MRRLLDGLYLATGALSAICILCITLLILAQIAGRFLSVHIPGSDDVVAWLTAGAIFLGLPYAMTTGAHIRVELLTAQLPPRIARRIEYLVLVGSIGLVGWAANYVTRLVIDSYRYGELAIGQLPIPIWIPQLSFAIGVDILLVVLVDCLVLMSVGREPLYRRVVADGEAVVQHE